MSMVVTVKQTVENGGKIKPTLDDLRVPLSHNGPRPFIATFFFTERLARRQFNSTAEFPFCGRHWVRAGYGKWINSQLRVTTYTFFNWLENLLWLLDNKREKQKTNPYELKVEVLFRLFNKPKSDDLL